MIDAARGLAWLVVLSGAVGCEEQRVTRPRARVEAAGSSSDPVVARAGSLVVTSSMVSASAAARGVSPRVALEGLIDDAVAANAALVRELDQRDDVRRGLDAALARDVLRRLRAAAIAEGPVTDDEVAMLTARHWKDVDLPERVRVVHAVVLRKKDKVDPARAAALAEKIRDAVVGAASQEDFEKRAKAVPKDGMDVVVQPLPYFAADGRVTERGDDAQMALDFTKAAFALTPDATSAVVPTDFGWHVIRLLDRQPEDRVPLEKRREMFAAEAHAIRSRKAYEALIARQQKTFDPKIETYAETALASVRLSSEKATP